MVRWLHCFGPEVKQNIMAEGVWWRKTAYLMATGKQRERKGAGT